MQLALFLSAAAVLSDAQIRLALDISTYNNETGSTGVAGPELTLNSSQGSAGLLATSFLGEVF